MVDPKPFKPNWIVHPGESIDDALSERGLTQVEFAERMGISKKHANDLMKGRARVSPETAASLAAVLGSTPRFWLNLQSNYDAELVRFEREKRLEAEHAGWLKELPFKEMADRGWVQTFPTVGARIEESLRYFATASVEAWRNTYGERVVAFRTSTKFANEPGATAAWLRKGEIDAGAMACAPWDPVRFKALLPSLRALTTEPDVRVFLPKLKEACATVGVVAVLVPAPKGCRASGATFFLTPDKAVLLLSGRFKRDDQLWFTFFHEAGHLVLHGKKKTFIEGEGTTGEEEDEANTFAANLLVPPAEARALRNVMSEGEVRDLAARLGVAPGIVVGRMQREGWIPFSHMNGLKVGYDWGEDG